MKKRNKIIIALVIIVIAGIIAFPAVKNYLVYSYGKRDVQSEAAAFTMTSKNIVDEFTANTEASNKKYLEKPVAVLGMITAVNEKAIILDNTVDCSFTTADPTVKVGQKVTVKGRVVGYDDLLGELKLDQCIISTNK